jgi:hypothetical protein
LSSGQDKSQEKQAFVWIPDSLDGRNGTRGRRSISELPIFPTSGHGWVFLGDWVPRTREPVAQNSVGRERQLHKKQAAKTGGLDHKHCS